MNNVIVIRPEGTSVSIQDGLLRLKAIEKRKLLIEYPRRFKLSPPGRNEICPCGSGKKYKRCCYKTKSDEELKALQEANFR